MTRNGALSVVAGLFGTLAYFTGSAGQLHFPNAIGIDTHGNVFVGEVDAAKRIRKFAPVMTGGRQAGCIRREFRWPGRASRHERRPTKRRASILSAYCSPSSSIKPSNHGASGPLCVSGPD